MPPLDAALDTEAFCYLTTTGRVTGNPHTIEIWFARHEETLYLLAGDRRSDWVLNLRRQPRVSVRIAGVTYEAGARIVTGAEEDARARRLLLAKYAPTYSGDLADWGRTALTVALEVDT